MRRVFWLAMGLGAGVTAAVMTSRWLKRQQQRLSPANLGAVAGEGVRDLGRLVREALEAGREEMARTEGEIRASLAE